MFFYGESLRPNDKECIEITLKSRLSILQRIICLQLGTDDKNLSSDKDILIYLNSDTGIS